MSFTMDAGHETPFTPHLQGLFRSLLFSVVIPAIVVQMLVRVPVSLTAALAISALFPTGYAVADALHGRRVDVIAALSLFFIAAGVVTSLVNGDVRLAIAKDAWGTAAFGAVCFVSLLAQRPMMFFLGRQFYTGNDPKLEDTWNARWDIPRVRVVTRIITAVWGTGYVLEAGAIALLAYSLPPQDMAIFSPALSISTTLALLAWTVAFVRAARRGLPQASILDESEKSRAVMLADVSERAPRRHEA
jgi:hypothetical protein